MKCQKCGRNEVNFHYSSAVNGHVTQMHLCSQCASQSGYNVGQMFGNMFTLSDVFPLQSLMAIPVLQLETRHPFTEQQCTCNGCGTLTPDVKNIEVDEKLLQKRELNKQMRIAAENEEFEKAAEIRDKLKKLES